MFYRHVHLFVSIGSICKLVVLLFRCCVTLSENENESNHTEDSSVKTIIDIVHVMIELLRSVKTPLLSEPRYEECVAFLETEISATALHPRLLRTIAANPLHPHLVGAWWQIIALLPPSLEKTLMWPALTQLEQLTPESPRDLLAGLLAALAHWNQLPAFLESLVESSSLTTYVVVEILWFGVCFHTCERR